MNHKAEQPVIIKHFHRYASFIAYAGLALVVALAFYLNNVNQKEDQKARCLSGVDTRNVQRALVEAVYNLAAGAAERDANAPPLEKDDLKHYNDYISRVNNFRDDQYKLIKPADVCAEYVKDDSIKPPTPPIPPLTNKESINP